MVSWVIEYWNDKAKKVECFSSEDGSWEEAPKNNVVFVRLTYPMSPPFGSPDTVYKTSLNGKDYYFLEEINGILYFGGFNDEFVTPTSTAGHRTLFTLLPTGELLREVDDLTEKYDFISDKVVKAGVWVEEPWATKLGLIEGGPRRKGI